MLFQALALLTFRKGKLGRDIQITAVAAPCLQAVNRELALQTKAVLDVTALEKGGNDEGAAAVGARPPAEARGVDGAPVLEVGVVVKTVVGLSESDAGAAAGDEALVS